MGMPASPGWASSSPWIRTSMSSTTNILSPPIFRSRDWDLHIKQSIWNYLNKRQDQCAQDYEERDEFVRTYVSTIKGHTQFGERLDFDAAFIYAHSGGKADLTTVPMPWR